MRKWTELTNSRLCILGSIELDNASTTGTTIRLVLDLSTLHRSNCGEELNEVIVRCRPRKLVKLANVL